MDADRLLIEQRRREAEAVADAEYFARLESSMLSEMREQRRARVGDERTLPVSARGPVRFIRCAKCRRVQPASAMNTIVSTRPRGGNLEGQSHKRTQRVCSACIVAGI